MLVLSEVNYFYKLTEKSVRITAKWTSIRCLVYKE